MRKHTRYVMVAVATAIAANLAATVTPAYAVVETVLVETVRVSAISTLVGSQSQKFATATCTGGRRLVGAGANINGGGGHVVIDEIRPNGSHSIQPTAVTVWALEDQSGTNASWTVTAYAICSYLPFQGHFRHYVVSPLFSSAPYQEVTVSCPSGTSFLGSGFDIGGGNGQVKLYEVEPSNDSVRVSAIEDYDGFGGSWTLTAYAICGHIEGATYSYPNDNSDLGNPWNAAYKSISCPSGDTLLSAGLIPYADFGDLESRLTVDEISPGSTPTSVSIWVLEDPSWPVPDTINDEWWFDAYAVCINPAP